jgi:hypothetical protein
MDETRAVARLPHLDIEIRHCRLPEEQAEQLAIIGFAASCPSWRALWRPHRDRHLSMTAGPGLRHGLVPSGPALRPYLEPKCQRAIEHGADDQLRPSAFVVLSEAHP